MAACCDLLPVRLRAPRRVGGRLSWRDRAHRPRRDRDRHRARSAAHRRSPRRIRAGERAAVPSPPGSCWRSSTRASAARDAAVALRSRGGTRAGRPGQRPAVARGAGGRRSRIGGGPERDPVPPRSGLGHLPRPGRVRSGRGAPRARRCAGGCRQADRSPRRWSRLEAAAPEVDEGTPAGGGAPRRPVRQRAAAGPCAGHGERRPPARSVRERGRPIRGARAARTFADVARGRAGRLRGLLRAGSPWR